MRLSVYMATIDRRYEDSGRRFCAARDAFEAANLLRSAPKIDEVEDDFAEGDVEQLEGVFAEGEPRILRARQCLPPT